MGKTRKTMVLLVFIVFVLLCAVGCEKQSLVYYSDPPDPVIFGVRGQTSDSLTHEPIDSVAILMEFTNSNVDDSIGFFSDSLGEFFYSINGYYRDEFDIHMSFTKTGYLTKETTLVVTHQMIFFDSLNIYLTSE